MFLIFLPLPALLEFHEKAHKAANAMRKGHCIIQLGSSGCGNVPADSRQNSNGVQGAKPLEAQDPYILVKLKGDVKTQYFHSVLQYKNPFSKQSLSFEEFSVKESIFQHFSFPFLIFMSEILQNLRYDNTV